MRDVTAVGGRIGAALLLSSVIAACGGGGVSKAEIIKRGNVICRRASDQLLADGAPDHQPSDPVSPYATKADWIDAALNIEQVLPALRQERDGFNSLGLPDSGRATFRQILANLNADYAATIRLDTAAHSRDPRAFTAASNAADSAGGKWLALADKFGFADCTTNGL